MSETSRCVTLDRVSLALEPMGEEWRVVADATLRAGQLATSTLLVDPSLSPLALDAVTSDHASCNMIFKDGAETGFFQLDLPERSGRSWDGVTLRFHFRWSPSGRDAVTRHSARVRIRETPCLVMPDMMPQLRSVDDSVPGVRSDALPRVTIDSGLPPELALAWVAASEEPRKQRDALLQAVVFPSQQVWTSESALSIVRAPSAQVTPEQLVHAHHYALGFLRFVESRFGHGTRVHPALCLTHTPWDRRYPASGAFAAIEPEYAGARTPNVGKPQELVRMFAQSWLGGAVRLSGENALELTLAVGGSLGMCWLRHARQTEALKRSISMQECALRETRSSDHLLKHRVYALQLPLFRGFEANVVGPILQRLTHDHWGSFLPQTVLIDELRRIEVPVPGVFM